MKIIKYSVFLFMLLLSGCFGPVNVKPVQTYQLKSIPCNVPQKYASSRVLLVMPPETSPAYNTIQIAYSKRPYQIEYYGQNQWIATPSAMMQPLMVQTLQNTHHFAAVVTPPFIGQYNYILTTNILEFQQDFTCRRSVMRVRVLAQLTSVARGRVIATKMLTVTVPFACPPYGGVVAANRATEKMLRQLAEFVLRNT